MADLTLRHPDVNGGTAVRVLATRVAPQFTRLKNHKPDATGTDIKEVQVRGIENPSYQVFNVKLRPDISGSLTYSQLIEFMKIQFDGTNPIEMRFNYGEGTGTRLTSYYGSSDYIPVVLYGIGGGFSSVDTKDGYMPNLTLQFIETKVVS